jgi:ubiquinone/menaquinone biosynthesis C-methylase UbiE
MRNYDTVAWFYDRLSRIVFGSALINAQLYLLSAIPAGAKILIAGGGTGWILEEITKLHPSGLTITYIDASAKMIARSRKRNTGNNKVVFITSTVEAAQIDSTFNIIMTPFLFDNLTEETAQSVFFCMDKLLLPHGKWLYSDYQDTSIYWQRVLLRAMYIFFGAFSGVKAKRLPPVESYFSQNNYTVTGQKTFFKNFVVSYIYEKG